VVVVGDATSEAAYEAAAKRQAEAARQNAAQRVRMARIRKGGG
jgi:hypothetical protein